MLGSALKANSGNPDFDDWEQVRFKQNQLIESESNQVEINSKVQTRLNELSKSINAIYKSDEMDKSHLFEIILAKNRIIINDLENLIFSITLARINLINPVILDEIDIKLITKSSQTLVLLIF